MIKLGPNKYLVQQAEDLPDFRGARRLYKDYETRSGDQKRGGDNPWAGDRICGIAVTADDCEDAFYVPVRHSHGLWNVQFDWAAWNRDQVETCTDWVNHNVKFDAHFAATDGAVFRGRLVDTLTLAKLVDSDRGFGRGGYGLDALSNDWLDEPIDVHDQELQAYLKGIKSKDYADAPADVLGIYACQDVLTNRKLYAHLCSERDKWARESPRFHDLWETEVKLTPVLWDMERAGLRVDPGELKRQQYVLLTQLLMLQEQLHELTGYAVEPSNSADCYELLCNRFGLPVLAWTEGGSDGKEPKPSFDKHALEQYSLHPDVVGSERYSRVLAMMRKYKKLHTSLTFFVEPYLKRQVDGRLHPQYNQLIRTGRMSGKQPNPQQLDEFAKSLVHPDTDGDAFLCQDASQIEFRLIAHYSQDAAVIDAYARDPDTDFHTWVANMCGIPRKPAKNVNFCIGYGGGKRKVLSMLASNMELVGSLGEQVERLVAEGKVAPTRRREAFQMLCQARAEQVYRQYHETLPGLRRVTDKAALLVKRTGFVFNEMGRIRRLPERAAWRAFNSLTQGLAGDLVKAAMVRVAPRYCEYTRSRGVDLRINVHDELVLHGSRDVITDPRVQATTTRALEASPVPLRVPIRFECNVAHRSWAEQEKQRVDRTQAEDISDKIDVPQTGAAVMR